MTKLIYIGIAFLLVLMLVSGMAASRTGEQSNVSVFAYMGFLGLVVARVARSVSTAAAQSTPITVVSGPITVLSVDPNRVSDIVSNWSSGGTTKGWMEVLIDGAPAFMRTAGHVSPGGTVTAAGIAGTKLEILAIRDHATQQAFSLAQPEFSLGRFARHVAFQTLFLVPVIIGFFTLKGTTRGYNWTHAMRRAIDESRRLVLSGGGQPPSTPTGLGW